jgi:hypothetical protein
MIMVVDQPQWYPDSIENFHAKRRILKLLKSDCCCVILKTLIVMESNYSAPWQ